MSVEKIKMMNRSKKLSERIRALNVEKVNAEKEQMDIIYNCEHEIIVRDRRYGYAECIFCGNSRFAEHCLKNNLAVILVSKLEDEQNIGDSIERVKKKYKEIWVEDDELSEEEIREEIREKLREEFK